MAKHPTKRVAEPPTVAYSDEDSNAEMGDFEDLEATNEDVVNGAMDSDAGSDDEWAGMNDDEENPQATPVAAAHASGQKTHVLPSGEELRRIKEASELFQSSSFKLQIDALLPNVRPKASRIPPLERFLNQLHTFLTSIPPVAPEHPLRAAERLAHKELVSINSSKKLKGGSKKATTPQKPTWVPFPAPLPTEQTQWTVAFEPPAQVTLIGSWVNKLSVRGRKGKRFGVDVAVEMPEGLFQEKDYLNSRFFHKRAFYLACIASALSNLDSGLNVETLYNCPSEDRRLMNLVLRPRQDGSPFDFSKLHAEIRIIPVLPQNHPIPISRLSPSHANMRIMTSTSTAPDTSYPATPLYNTALLLPCAYRAQLLATHATINAVPAFTDALALLRVWANQRGYGGAVDGDGSRVIVGFEDRGAWWSNLLQLLIYGEQPFASSSTATSRRKGLGKGLSSYQLFKAALDYLAHHNYKEGGTFVKNDNGHRFLPEEYIAHHEAVFVDSTSMVNMLSGVPLSSLDMLKVDASASLEILDMASENAFHELFLKDHHPVASRYDIVLKVDLSSANPELPPHDLLEAGSRTMALLKQVAKCLRKGLDNRTLAIAILHRAQPSSSTSNPRILSSDLDVYIGLVLDQEHAFRLVDQGPAAAEEDSVASKEFRDLWGDKAELRRFKDGRIIESVVWDVKNSDERTHIPVMIIRHLLQRHFGITSSSVISWQGDFDSLTRIPPTIAETYQRHEITGGFKPAMAAFDDIVRVFKNLDDHIPLGVLAVHPVSSYLRHTSTFAPVPLPANLASFIPTYSSYLPPMELVIEFEKSGRWPDDLRVIQKMKLALLEQLALGIMEKSPGSVATVVVGQNDLSPIEEQGQIEIHTASGWAFRARIWHAREAVLLDRIIDDKSHIKRLPAARAQLESNKAKERHQAIQAREVYTRRFIHAPRHHRMIAALCHRAPAYAGTVRLVKRWFASHWLLDTHVSEEAVELLCARVFFGGGAKASTPGSKERGFAAVVSFLSEWQWEGGIHVPLEEGDLTSLSALTPKSAGVNAWRISTAADPEGSIWTAGGPDSVVARRIRTIAQATWAYLATMEDGPLDVKGMFIHPTDDYDFIIQLDRKILPRYAQNICFDESTFTRKGTSTYINLMETEKSTITAGLDPAELFRGDLMRVYGDTFKLFHDSLGGDRFGAVWDPAIKTVRPFRILGGFSSAPAPRSDKTKEKGLVILNEDAVLSEIARIGEGIVASR